MCATPRTGRSSIHVVTKKGKGYAPAEDSADKYHGVSKFNVLTGEQKKSAAKAPDLSEGLRRGADRSRPKKDDRIVAITAAMPSGTGLDLFQKAFPDALLRCRHCRAAWRDLRRRPGGRRHEAVLRRSIPPSCSAPTTRWCTTWRSSRLPVRFAMDRAGLVGADGPTHAGSFDIAYLATLPGFVRDGAVRRGRAHAHGGDGGRRSTTGRAPPLSARRRLGLERPPIGTPLEIGKGRIVREGTSIAILNFGARLQECLLAAEKLSGLRTFGHGGRCALRQAARHTTSSAASRASTKCSSPSRKAPSAASPPM